MAETDLLTAEDRVALLVNALSDERDPFPVAKLFTPDAGATWLLSECDPDESDRLFGICDLGLGCPEIGYVSLTEIMSIRGPLGLSVERDLRFVAHKSLTAYAEEARIKRRIVA
jgi:hypothetical protein